MITFRSIIDRWPSAEKLNADLGLKTYSHARMMKRRNNIPIVYWPRMLEAAKKRGISLTRLELASALAARKPSATMNSIVEVLEALETIAPPDAPQ